MDRSDRMIACTALLLGLALPSSGCQSLGRRAADLDAAPASSKRAVQTGADRSLPPVAMPVGIGFTADPSTFLLSGALDVPATNNVTFGPSVHAGFADHRTLVGVTAQAKYRFDLEGGGEAARRLKPFVQAGVGFVYLDEDRPASEDDFGWLLDLGGGTRYRLDERLSLGSQMMFHLVPGGVLGEHFYFSWEVVQVVLDF